MNGRGCLDGHYYASVANRTVAEGLSLYYPRFLYCPDQMLAVMMLSQLWVLSFKTVRSCAPRGARCKVGNAIWTWFAVSLGAPTRNSVME